MQINSISSMISSPYADFDYQGTDFDRRAIAVCWEKLSHLECFYPDFRSWYQDVVMPGIKNRERKILIEGEIDNIRGIAILKKTSREEKICTIWVDESFRGRGVATNLMRKSFLHLKTNRPLFTVPQERWAEFQKIVEQYQFKEVQVLDSWYRAGKKEYVYNGFLFNPIIN